MIYNLDNQGINNLLKCKLLGKKNACTFVQAHLSFVKDLVSITHHTYLHHIFLHHTSSLHQLQQCQ